MNLAKLHVVFSKKEMLFYRYDTYLGGFAGYF